MKQDTNNQQPDSIIKSIMVEQEEKSRGALDPLAVIMVALGALKDREREILTNRFGLDDGKKITLEAVGQKFQITRERVRQIEAAAIKRLAKKPSRDLIQLIKVINSSLLATGGLVSLDGLASYLKVVNDERRHTELNALRLIMNVNDQVAPLKKADELSIGWVKRDFPVDLLLPIIVEVEHILVSADKTITSQEIWKQLAASKMYAEQGEKITQEILEGVLAVASKLAQARDGKWGLTAWPTVVPKRIRDKIYLILQASHEPVHFQDITEALNREYPGKKVLSRTVHNELIGDPRFVLVGRGIYALRAWGYKPGVVSDVIKDVLTKASQSLSTDEIVKEVLSHRQVKRNTVIANLQNKDLFKKVSKGTYTLA